MLDGRAKSVGKMLSIELWGPIRVAGKLGRGQIDSMRPLPKRSRKGEGIDALPPPPGPFIAASVELAMVQPAEGDGKAVADSPAQRPLLGKLDVVGIGGAAPADQARLRGHQPQMVAIALTHRLANDGNFIRASFAPPRLAAMAVRLVLRGLRRLPCLAGLGKPEGAGAFNRLGISRRELVLEGKGPVRPRGESVRSFELLELSYQLAPKAFRRLG